MKAKHVMLIVAASLICGGLAGYASAHVSNGVQEPEAKAKIVVVEQLHFIDSSGNHRATLELAQDRGFGLVLKDSRGKPLYDLPPSFRVMPVERSR